MKIKFKVADSRAVFEYVKNNASLEEAVDLLQRDEVISISVSKCTPTQYLKGQKAINE